MPVSNVLLLSGGIESSCLAWWLRPHRAYTVDYGQIVAKAEIAASRQVCLYLCIEHEVITAKIDFVKTGLLSGDINATLENGQEFWPFLNQFIITCAAIKAHQDNIKEIIIGTMKDDSRFSDGTSQFIEYMSQIIRYQENIDLLAPAINMTSQDLIRISKTPRQILGLTFSCHVSDNPCGLCPGCRKNAALLCEEM